MLAAFLISLWATKVTDYEAVNDPRDVLEEFGDAPVSDEEFFDSRIAEYVVAWERNSAVNDRKASRLKVAGYALLLGITLQATLPYALGEEIGNARGKGKEGRTGIERESRHLTEPRVEDPEPPSTDQEKEVIRMPL